MHKYIHLFTNVHTHAYLNVSVTIIKELIGHDFEREQSVVIGGFGEKKGNGKMIL